MKNIPWAMIIAIALIVGIRTFASQYRENNASEESYIAFVFDAKDGFSEKYRYDEECECFVSYGYEGEATFKLEANGETLFTYSVSNDDFESSTYSISNNGDGTLTLVDQEFVFHECEVTRGSYEDWLFSGERMVLEETKESAYKSLQTLMDDILSEYPEIFDCREGRMKLELGSGKTVVEGDRLIDTSEGVLTLRYDLDPLCLALASTDE